jgi:hypothetical protein
MKNQLNPKVAFTIIALVLIGAVFFVWKSSNGVNTGSGRMQSNLGPIEKDPNKLQQEIRQSIEADKKSHGQ